MKSTHIHRIFTADQNRKFEGTYWLICGSPPSNTDSPSYPDTTALHRSHIYLHGSKIYKRYDRLQGHPASPRKSDCTTVNRTTYDAFCMEAEKLGVSVITVHGGSNLATNKTVIDLEEDFTRLVSVDLSLIIWCFWSVFFSAFLKLIYPIRNWHHLSMVLPRTTLPSFELACGLRHPLLPLNFFSPFFEFPSHSILPSLPRHSQDLLLLLPLLNCSFPSLHLVYWYWYG